MARGASRRRFRCTGCGNCCRELAVPLTDSDLSRLTRASGERAEAIVDFVSPDEVDMTGEPSSFVEIDRGRRLMVLARTPEGCRFLDGDQCSVWHARPAACRNYPLEASFGKRAGVRRLRIVPRGVECRHELDGVASLGEVRRDLLAERAELSAYHERTARWNLAQRHRRRLLRRIGTASEFLTSLLEGRAT